MLSWKTKLSVWNSAIGERAKTLPAFVALARMARGYERVASSWMAAASPAIE
jgi:hypothetical protein